MTIPKTRPSISIVIPAYNESNTIAFTLQTLQQIKQPGSKVIWDELIVVDDGSQDDTADKACDWCDVLIRNDDNLGKGKTLEKGWQCASGDVIVFLDADLSKTVQYMPLLLEPLLHDQADMTIASFLPSLKKGGFGLVKGLANRGIYQLSGYQSIAPLSGQRAIRKEILQNLPGLSRGFGIEVGLTIDVARMGYRIQEVQIPFQHRETGRNWSGFVHRGKQFSEVSQTLWQKWWNPIW